MDKRAITVMTDDGEVPVESISQGTSSLMGWVGVLLRRLYDVYGDGDEPLARNALVLIDEIDAHMHPEWQQFVAPLVRKLFPNAQVIATTHSPLIVPSLQPEEIIRLKRGPGENRISVQFPNYNVRDYRADQVLTSPLFGLESSLSPEMQRRVRLYTDLAARDELSAEEEQALERLAYDIGVKLPSPAERIEARIAYNLIQYALNKHIEHMEPALTENVTAELKVQLQELITGSRRP